MGKILYGSLYCIFYLVSLLPLTILYAISDGIYYMMYYVVRYRRHLVRKHLIDCFPEKSDEERLKIEREFYSWLCDYYCNWEWVTSLPLWAGEDITFGQIYHVLENSAFDKLFLYLRNRLGAISIPMAETLRKIVKMRQEGKQIVIGFIADQAPFWNNIHYWTDFLHHDSPVLTGTEKIAIKANFAVYYLDMQRVKRGYYKGEFKLLTDKPKECKKFEITEMYFRELEKTIQRQPPYWLWTHNRWKRTREQWLKVVDPLTHKMRRDLQ